MPKLIPRRLVDGWNAWRTRLRRRPKVFCIGRNKTGTTSLEAAMRRLGYITGRQAAGELLLEDWGRREFSRICAFAATAEFFQDIPFSLCGTWEALDRAWPGSRFILTVRDSPGEWFASLVRYHGKLVGSQQAPTANQLRDCTYRQRGWLWRCQQLVYGADEATVYDEARYVQHYQEHNRQVREYFRDRSDDLLELNLADADAMDKLCGYLGASDRGLVMPHLNRSRL